MFRKSEIFRFLASLKLAILLLVVIIFASIFGTYYETQYSAEVARRYVYGNVWFDFWLALLCVNLFCVAAIRYPWKPHQTGFVITHAGIIILLIGSMIDRNWGIEGYLDLHRGQPPTDIMKLREQQLVVSIPGGEKAYTPFNVKAMNRQFHAKSPASDITVDVLDTKLVEPKRFFAPSEKGAPAIKLLLRGPAMGNLEPQWLQLSDRVDQGMAVISFLPGLPPPTPKTEESGEMRPRREKMWVFAKQPDVMTTTMVGDPTNAAAKLTLDEKTSEPALSLKIMDKQYSIPVKANIGKDYPLEGLDGWKLFIGAYYPNFRLVNNSEAANLNEKPDNPAVKFELLGPLVKGQVHEAPAAHGGAGGHTPGMAPGGGAANGLSVYFGDDGKLRYMVKSRVKGEFSGEVEQGKYVLLNWGQSGAEFTVDEFLPHAEKHDEWTPVEDKQLAKLTDSQREENYVYGVKCHVAAGGATKDFWLGMHGLKTVSDPKSGKTLVDMTPEFVQVGDKKLGLSFCSQFVMLPFKVGLLKFVAPTDEGTDMSFAAFESTLTFNGHLDFIALKPEAKVLKQPDLPDALNGGRNTDLFGAIVGEDATELTMEFENGQALTVPKADVASWVQKTHKIFMNYPTTFPSTWYGPWLGTTYKFSQADHKMPADPNYSGVQVLRDPGWMPKWVGCLMICFGIFTMFYLKPYFNRRPEPAAAKAVANDKRDTAAEKSKKRGTMAETV
jgi:hypothetical protein